MGGLHGYRDLVFRWDGLGWEFGGFVKELFQAITVANSDEEN